MLGDTEAPAGAIDLEAEYEILGELGRGGMAIVYLARDRELGREVAIKVIRPRFVEDEEAVARLAREARTVAQLQHPNIVTIFAVRRLRDGGLALVMQLVPGSSLREVLQTYGALSFERSEQVLRDVASALAHAHRQGYVHRDVKPENIFIEEGTGRALLSDFGVARPITSDGHLTMTGTAIGTPTYMSPEQIDSVELDGRSDLYSLGLIAWEMLSGQRPWEGEGLYGVIYKQKREQLPPLDTIREGVPERLLYLVEGLLPKHPGHRWSSADAFLDRMDNTPHPSEWRRWQIARRRRSRAYDTPSLRRETFIGAALETMRFRRPDSSDEGERVSVATGPSGYVEPRLERTAPPEPMLDEFVFDEGESVEQAERRPARRWALLAIAVVAVLAGGTYGAMRLRSTDDGDGVRASFGARFGDSRAIEVPVRPPASAKELVPTPLASSDTARTNANAIDTTANRAASALTSAAPDSGSRLAATPPPPEVVQPRSESPISPVPPNKRVDEPAPVDRRSPARPTPAQSAFSTPTPPTLTLPVAPRADSTRIDARALPSTWVAAPVSFPAERLIVAAGGRHSCALGTGTVLCWGANDHGQLGGGHNRDRSEPTPVAGELNFVQVTTGGAHTCAITRGGDAYCWGDNERGQLGDATTLQRSAPVRVAGSADYRALRAGLAHTCGLTPGGTALCWGSNAYGQLGAGGLSELTSPTVVGVEQRFGALAVGWNHTCAVSVEGAVYCWGINASGQLGDGTRTSRRSPTRVASDVRFVGVAAGSAHTCAVAVGGEVYCWGKNANGLLGTGAGESEQLLPAKVGGLSDAANLTAGGVHTCARTQSGQTFCWGRNTYGQLGDGTTADRSAPVRVLGAPAFASVNASGAHTCGATASGESFCWGYNVEGQLGDGTRSHRARPVRVTVGATR